MASPDRAADYTYHTDSLSVNPEFNFINKLLGNSTTGTENDNSNFFFSNDNDSPYFNCNFSCDYIGTDNFTMALSTNDFYIMTLNLQSINSKFADLLELVHKLAQADSLPEIICLQEL